MINYPKEFKEKCKKVYPNWTKLHSALEQGREIVGRYLDDSRYGTISIDEILTAKSLESLQSKALKIQEKSNLYSEWDRIYNSQK